MTAPSRAAWVARTSLLVGAATLPVAEGACHRTPSVEFSLGVPRAVGKATAWIDVAAYPDATCPVLDALREGPPPGGSVARARFAAAVDGPALGTLAPGTYAFAAAVRNASCEVLASGCSVRDVPGETVKVDLTTLDAPLLGGCGPGAECRNGACEPASDSSRPHDGCSLALVGAGPLGERLLEDPGESTSPPSIVAVPGGFLVAYRQYDPGGKARVVLLRIDDGGGASGPQSETLPLGCANVDENDGVGLALAGAYVDLAVARHSPCQATSGFDLALFAPDGKPASTSPRSGAELNPALVRASVALAPGHALAAAADGKAYLAFVKDGAALLDRVDGVRFSGNAIGTLGAARPHTAVALSASNSLLGILVGSPVTPSGVPGTTPTDPSLRLQVAAPSDDLAALLPPAVFAGRFGSLSVENARVAVISGELDRAPAPLALRIFEASSGAGGTTVTQKQIARVPVEARGAVSYADVALRGTLVAIVAEVPGHVEVSAFQEANAGEGLTRTAHIALAGDARIPSVGRVREGQIAVAIDKTRVAVAWTTAKTSAADDSVGGYALFACNQP